MDSFWERNLEVIKRRQPDLLPFLQDGGQDESRVGEIALTPAGVPSLVLLKADGRPVPAYNSQDPWRDAAGQLKSVENESRSLVVFVGMGLGYGPLLALREHPALARMAICEPSVDLFRLAVRHVDLTPLFSDPRIRWFVGEPAPERLSELVDDAEGVDQTVFTFHSPSFQWREELYRRVKQQVVMVLNRASVSESTTLHTGQDYFQNRMANLTALPHGYDLGRIKDLYSGLPAVLVGAGPSLDACLPVLRRLVGRCVLISVDSALAPLLNVGINPDFVTAIDFRRLNFEKVSPFIGREHPFSLVALSKVFPDIPKRVAARHLLWAFSDELPEKWFHQALGIETLCRESMSVALLSLEVARIMGCDPIVFVGQDLAFSGGQGHAGGTIVSYLGVAAQKKSQWQVRGLDGSMLPTNQVFMAVLRQIEEIIAADPGRTYLNSTAAGATIQGAQEIDLARVGEEILTADLPAGAMLDETLANKPCLSAAAIVDSLTGSLERIGPLMKTLAELQSHIQGLRRELQRLARNPRNRRPGALHTGAIAKKISKLNKLNKKLDAVPLVNDQVIELVFPFHKEDEQLVEQNRQIMQREGEAAWLLAEMDRHEKSVEARRSAYEAFRRLAGAARDRLVQEQQLLEDCRREPAAAATVLELAELYCRSGDYLAARRTLARLPAGGQEEETEGRRCLLAAEIGARLFDFSAAHAAWAAAGQLSAKWREAATVARCRQAEYWLRVVAETVPLNSATPGLTAMVLRRAAQFVAGDELPEQLLKLWQQHQPVLLAWLRDGQIAKAEPVLDAWTQFADRLPEIVAMQARREAAQGNESGALAKITEALAVRPQEPRWMALQARWLLETGDFDQGLARLQEAVALDPATAELWEELGDTLLAGGDHQGAIAAFEKCFLALPNRWSALLKMGDCYRQVNQPEAARAAYDAVLAKEPAHEGALQRRRSLQVSP